MDEEKRRTPRVALDVRVNSLFDTVAHTRDISEGGICLITEFALEAGKMLNLAFLLPQREAALRCFGKVMWSRQASAHYYENGISFWDIKDADRAAIADYVRSATEAASAPQ